MGSTHEGLVNPVHPKYPAGFCTSFLITDQLGSLRQHFHNFRFEMFPSRSAAGEPLSALEVRLGRRPSFGACNGENSPG
eukprot:s43_g34.t1